MKRRSFLQSIGAAVAALFVSAVAAEKFGFTQVLSPKITVTAPVGKTLWVDGANVFREGKDGSFEHPYLTLQDAVERSQVGDAIVIWPGYTERFTWSTPS